ncbi:hypothetical protein ANSO36C_68400 (plasmid) [Nostoc cf. commune SO-36]|uniref:CopG family transcriptional regulator n=1 Tax=Nostoc cf. commune SO-36 TaxID=449208 RepID=A0ABN6QD13_NOSCO|nr:hypothetical protein [Nostoc commune]BDI21038.1 hypothetical protein ANSO36C_68400 [Nostoc cf. commune SO-36]
MENKPRQKSKKPRKKSKIRELREKKIICKGLKSLRGQPEFYDELKKIVSVSLTPTAIEGLNNLSRAYMISRSELIERIGRYVIQLIKVENLD